MALFQLEVQQPKKDYFLHIYNPFSNGGNLLLNGYSPKSPYRYNYKCGSFTFGSFWDMDFLENDAVFFHRIYGNFLFDYYNCDRSYDRNSCKFLIICLDFHNSCPSNYRYSIFGYIYDYRL